MMFSKGTMGFPGKGLDGATDNSKYYRSKSSSLLKNLIWLLLLLQDHIQKIQETPKVKFYTRHIGRSNKNELQTLLKRLIY